MVKLHSVLSSGRSLYVLTEVDGSLALHESEYEGMDQVPYVLKSAQPYMAISPDDVGHIDIQFSGEMIYIQPSEQTNPFLSSALVGDHVVFFLNVEPKVLIHVQPNFSEFNFREYEHPSIEVPMDKMMAEFEKKVSQYNTNLNDFMKDIDRIAEEVAAIEVDTLPV